MIYFSIKKWRYFQDYIVQKKNFYWIFKVPILLKLGNVFVSMFLRKRRTLGLNLKVKFKLDLKGREFKSNSKNWMCVCLNLSWFWWYFLNLFFVLFDAVKKRKNYVEYMFELITYLIYSFACLRKSYEMNMLYWI